MSDRPIQRGDIVVVVKPSICTKDCAHIGYVFKVTEVAYIDETSGPLCHYCRTLHSHGFYAIDETGRRFWAFRRLKRLDPDALKDDVPTREELTA